MTNDHREYALSDGDVCPPAIYKATSITKSQSSTLDYRDEDCALCGAPFHIHRYVGHMTALGNLTHHDEMEARVETVAESLTEKYGPPPPVPTF